MTAAAHLFTSLDTSDLHAREGSGADGAEARLLDIREARRLSTPVISRPRHPSPEGAKEYRSHRRCAVAFATRVSVYRPV